MFARTSRLTLRPPWPEDAAALAEAIGHRSVVGMLSRVPLPYALADAEAFVAGPRAADEPRFLIVAHDTPEPCIVGGIGIAEEDGAPSLGYWITPRAWGRGYATEAGAAVVAMARHALPLDRLAAWHFADNPASGRVLRKLGFVATGRVSLRPSIARREAGTAIEYAIDLGEQRPLMRIAA